MANWRGQPDDQSRGFEPGDGRDSASSASPRSEQDSGRARALNILRGRTSDQSDAANPGASGERGQSVIPSRNSSSKTRRIEQRLSVTTGRTVPVVESRRESFVAFPQLNAKIKRNHAGLIGFLVCVALPVLIASLYYGLIASNQYVAEFRFSVQDTTPGTMALPTGVTAVLGSSGSSATNNNYLVADFLTSQEAIDEMQKRINLVSLYTKPDIDWWSRFSSTKPIEKFVPYWQSMASASYDQVTGLASATVRAFSPQDALLAANTMVTLSEELINQIANRAQRDAVQFAQAEVNKAQDRLRAERARLTDYRNRVGVIDPTTSVGASNSALVQTQRAALAQLETQLATLLRQNLSQDSPTVITLKNQIKSMREQLAATEADVGRGVNGAALSKVVGEYEQINLEVQFAQTMVTSTMAALDQARANAAAQHIYITPYVRPRLPQSSIYPNRFLSILAVAAIAFAVWMIMLLIVRSVRERFA